MMHLPRPLFVLLTVACLHAVPTAGAQETELKVGGTGTTLGTMHLLGKAFEQANTGTAVNVLSSLGSTGGIKAVFAGAINIGLSARPQTDSEQQQGTNAIEYGRSPLALTVPRSLAVTGISKASTSTPERCSNGQTASRSA